MTLAATDLGMVAGPAWRPRRAARQTTVASFTVVALAAVAGGLAPDLMGRAGPIALVAAGLLGLPHGAVDHLALGWARGRTGAARPGVLVAYLLAALTAAALAVAAPAPALLVLLVLSAAHFAEGEAAFDRLRGGPGLAAPALALGSAVVVAPLLLRPAAVGPLLTSLAPALPGLLGAVRLPVLLLTAVLIGVGLLVALRAKRYLVAGELAVVVGAAVLGPPLLAFAAWFALWHGPRHLVRLLALEPNGNRRERVRRLARGAAVPTLVAATGLVGLALLLGGLPGAVLIALLALTVPHAAVVARLDRISGQRPAAQQFNGLAG